MRKESPPPIFRRPSTIPYSHGGSHSIESLRVSGEETFCFFETWRPERGSNPRSPTFQADSCNHCTRAPVLYLENTTLLLCCVLWDNWYLLIYKQAKHTRISNIVIRGPKHEVEKDIKSYFVLNIPWETPVTCFIIRAVIGHEHVSYKWCLISI